MEGPMKKLLMLGGAVLVFALNSVAAYADCKLTCDWYCGYQHPSNPGAEAICWDGCMVGCDRGPPEPTVPAGG